LRPVEEMEEEEEEEEAEFMTQRTTRYTPADADNNEEIRSLACDNDIRDCHICHAGSIGNTTP
jgi:hypothetical protein